MILPDTSIWIDHLRQPDLQLLRILSLKDALCHPFIVGEIALGAIPRRDFVLAQLQAIRQSRLARNEDVLSLIERQSIHGRGIGLIDAHLLASVMLTPEAKLWTRDKRLRAVARQLDLDAELD